MVGKSKDWVCNQLEERGRKLKSLEGDREVKKLKRLEKGTGSKRERES